MHFFKNANCYLVNSDTESNKLRIDSASAGLHSGRYTCVAHNEAGRATADFAVDVLVKPRFKVRTIINIFRECVNKYISSLKFIQFES